jgi:hypothetical protein
MTLKIGTQWHFGDRVLLDDPHFPVLLSGWVTSVKRSDDADPGNDRVAVELDHGRGVRWVRANQLRRSK